MQKVIFIDALPLNFIPSNFKKVDLRMKQMLKKESNLIQSKRSWYEPNQRLVQTPIL